jgi:D-3-phosphoglycerate dehydrogenase
MKPRAWLDRPWPPEFIARLEEAADVVLADPARLPGVEILIVYSATGEIMDRVGPSLKHIARTGIGLDGIDIPAATARGILVTHTPDGPTESTAEHAVALLLAIAKRVVVGDMQLRGADLPRTLMVGTEVKGRTLGVVGYGRIGRRVAEICALGLRMPVVVFDPYLAGTPPTPEGVTFVTGLDTLLAQADFVTLHVPLVPATRHLIGERELRLMKPGGYLINASRGGVIDETALIKVLQEKHLAGAGLDVYDPEPPQRDNPLLKMTNVVVTPHIASTTEAGLAAMMNGAIDQILQVLRGERPTFLVNPEVWPGRLSS